MMCGFGMPMYCEKITTILFANILVTSYNYLFFVVQRTF